FLFITNYWRTKGDRRRTIATGSRKIGFWPAGPGSGLVVTLSFYFIWSDKSCPRSDKPCPTKKRWNRGCIGARDVPGSASRLSASCREGNAKMHPGTGATRFFTCDQLTDGRILNELKLIMNNLRGKRRESSGK